MSDEDGPWGGQGPRTRPRRYRLIVWLALVAAAAAGFWELRRLFPRQFSGDEWARAGYYLGFLALVLSGLVFGRRLRLREAARNAVIWIGIVAVFAVAVSFRGELKAVALRVRSEMVPGYAVATKARTLVVTRSDDGAFYVIGTVNGAPVRFLIDTGASDIVLSPADARRLGVDVSALNFNRAYETANGTGRGAALILGELDIGPIAFSHIAVTVNGAAMDSSLLGQPFFARLESTEIRGDRLFLRWRD
ncbi:MAG TPA: TIGR02281 family clan AA aspartic protease [Caulobacteraceae bacterium]